MNVRRFIAGSAMLLLLASATPAFAQPVPTPPVVPGTTNGLSADSSRSPIGFKPPTAANIDDYIKAVGAVEVNAAFHSTKEMKVSKDVKLGPFNPNINLVTMENGADVSLHAKYSKKDGSDVATLDGITLNAKGVNVGPQLGPLGLKFQRAEIHADGSMSVKLNSWIPELTIKKVEKQPNGDVKLIGSWWMPDCTITKDGDVKIGKVVKIFGKEIGGLKTVGKIDPRIFANWPPSLQDFMAIAAASSGAVPAGTPNPLAGTLKSLAGGLAWDVKAEAEGLPIEIEGAPVDAKTKLHLHGNANLEDGRFTTIGDKNNVNLQIDVAEQQFGNDKMGMTLKKGSMTLDGTYKLDIPLEDKSKMVVAFDGKAAYGAVGEKLHITLPTGAKINVEHLEVSREGDVHFNMNGANKVFKLDDARYMIAAKGPIHLEKLGPISSLDLDGELRSTGLSKIRADGLMALNGDLKGSMVVRNGGALARLDGAKGFYVNELKPGSRLDVDLHDLFAAIRLPVDGKKAGFEGANVRGKVGLHGEVNGLGYKDAGTIDVAAPSGRVDLTVDGRAKIRPTGVTGEGDVTGSVSLPSGATVAVTKGPITAKTSIDPGSHIDLNAHVARTADAAAKNEFVVTTANLNARNAPDLNGQVLKVIPKGTRLEVLSRQGDWAKVKGADGGEFFVNTKYVNTTSPAKPAGAGTTTVDGKITGDLGATDATVSAFGGNADLKAHVKAGIDAPFKATIGPDGKPKIDTAATRATLPIRVELKRGTKVSFAGQTVTLTDDACYVQVTGDIALDGNGKPVLKKLSNVDIELRLGNLGTQLFGLNLNVPNLATTRFKGDVTFGANGIQVHGNAQVTLGGQTAPLINITF